MDQSKLSRSESKLSSILGQHERVALQFSGGKDSLVCFYLLKPWWSRLIILWGNPGNEFPETVKQMENVRGLVASFHEIRGSSDSETTFPVDILPIRSTPYGLATEHGKQIPLQSRYDCCFKHFWGPMAERVKHLGITALIRGQRTQEELRPPHFEGCKDLSGAEIYLPIEDWTTEEVFEYLNEQGAEIPVFYQYMKAGPKCMLCTAWLKDQQGKPEYLKKFHPKVYNEYRRRMNIIKAEINTENRYG